MRGARVLGALILLAGCVQAAPDSPPADCGKRHAVARELAARHQYGADLQDYIRELGGAGATASELADYRAMAATLRDVPQLAGDFGREAGIAAGLEELGLTCP